jgi:HAD superfamily hydrolase (TIGR01509 family)
MTTIRAVIFDLDGVLVDSEYHSCSATAELLTARGIPTTEAEVRRRFLGKPIAAVYEHVRTLGHELPESFAREKEDLYFEKARAELRAFDGAHELVALLRAPKAIASSGSPRKVAFSLETTRLGELFEVVCTTAEVARGKPAPDLFLHAAGKLGVPANECAVVEDSEAGIQAARAADAFAIGITTTLTRDALTTAGAHAVIDSLAALQNLLPHLFA